MLAQRVITAIVLLAVLLGASEDDRAEALPEK